MVVFVYFEDVWSKMYSTVWAVNNQTKGEKVSPDESHMRSERDWGFFPLFFCWKKAVWCFPKQCVSERRDISYSLHEILKSVRAGNDSVKKKTAMQWEQNKFREHQLIMGSFQASYEVSRALLIVRVEGNPVLKLQCAEWLGANR